MSPAAARLRGLAALTVLVGIIAGMPALLLATRHTMLPTRLPTSLPGWWGLLTRPDDGTLALAVFYVVGWVAWAVFTGLVAVDLAARARRLRVPHLRGLTLPQATAHSLVGAVLFLFTATPLAVPLAPPVAATAAVATLVPTPPTGPSAAERATAAAPEHATNRTATLATREHEPPRPTVRHTVRRGETLWSIARDHLGTGSRFPEIAALNTDVLGDHPGFLQPGWILHLPATTTTHNEGEQAYVVRPGDTLTELAEDELGEASAYREIFDASTGITQPGGRHLTDPDVIDIGWTLTIPERHPTTHADHAVRPATPTSPAPAGRPPAKADASVPATTIPSVTAVTPVPSPTLEAPSPTPVTSVAPSPHAPAAEVVDLTGEGDAAPGWLRPAYTGAGIMLAGSLLLLLRQRRRAQRRHRRPGHTIPYPDPTVVPTEKSILLAGATGLPAVERVHATLLRLAASITAAGQDLPDLAAVELHPDRLTLHLRTPNDLPTPWTASDDPSRTVWSCSTRIDLDDIGPHIPDLPAPYPLLVTVGATDPTGAGGVWLLNAETFGVLTITGDPDRGADLARYLIAELGAHPWACGVFVHCVDAGLELEDLAPARIITHRNLSDIATQLLRDASDNLHAADHHDAVGDAEHPGVGPLLKDDAVWADAVLLLRQDDLGGDGVAALIDAVAAHPGRTAVTVIVLSTTDGDDNDVTGSVGAVLRIDGRARLRIDALDIDLAAVQLPLAQAVEAATVLGVADEDRDAPPPPAAGTHGWRAYADQSGNLLPEHTLPRIGDTTDDPDHLHADATGDDATDNDVTDDGEDAAVSVLDRDDIAYLATAPTTTEDLAALAPRVPGHVRAGLEDADPTLDDDVAAWFADTCPLPRLSVLGPMRVRSHGSIRAVAKRRPYYTGLLSYLATRPCGATVAETMAAFALAEGRVRVDVAAVRSWLGTNPRTGQPHIRKAEDSDAAAIRGVAAYQIDDLLIDADLFLRLRARGTARGPDGIADLTTALRLVTGEPFTGHPERGWAWLIEDRTDEHLTVAIVDVAHLLATHALADGHPDQARAAAETALLAAPYEEVPRLDLIAALRAAGETTEADRILHDDIYDRSDDDGPPMDLSDRTLRLTKLT